MNELLALLKDMPQRQTEGLTRFGFRTSRHVKHHRL
jgi:hypothetical protein